MNEERDKVIANIVMAILMVLSVVFYLVALDADYRKRKECWEEHMELEHNGNVEECGDSEYYEFNYK
jgi:hypothetical protein